MGTNNLNTQVYDNSSRNNHIPFKIGILIDYSNPVWTFNEVMEGVNLAQCLKVDRLRREPYNLFMMLKVILFYEMLGKMSYRG